MHHREIVVTCPVVIEHGRRHLIELASKLWIDILPQNLHVSVTVGTTLRVNVAESVHQLVYDDALFKAVFTVQQQRLSAARPAEIRFAKFPMRNAQKILFVVARTETNASFTLDAVHGIANQR